VRIAWCAAVLATAVLACVSCGPSGPRPLRIGVNAWPAYELLHLADVKGLFLEEGVAVRLLDFGSLSDARRALERGQLDGVATTVVELVQARANGRTDIKAAWVFDYSTGGDLVLAQPEVTDLASLKGRRIGVEVASVGSYVLTRALESAGLSFEDVTVVPTDQLTGERQFRDRDIDALVTYPPVSVRLTAEAGGRRLFDSSALPGEVVDVLVVDDEALAGGGEAVRAVIRAYIRASAFMHEHPQDAYRIMAEREGISPAEFEHQITQQMRLVPPAEQARYLGPDGLLASIVERTADVLRRSQQISGDWMATDVIPSPYPFPDLWDR
jgi:NitT/TauT family transport system substrate-binding protein